MRKRVTRLGCLFLLLGCTASTQAPRGNGSGGGGGEEPGGEAGTGGGAAGSGGVAGKGPGGSGGSLTGGSGGGGATGGTGGSAGVPDASIPDAGSTDTPVPADASTERPATNPPGYQGPMAAGKIEYSQDFEKDMAGLGRSPPSLPESRAQIVDDPLGQRGKVLRMQWLVGDEFKSAPQFKPKAFVSNASAFHYVGGDKISHAFGYMTPSTYIGATLAQNITGGDPIWMIQGRDDGIMDVVPGLVRLPVKLQANRWYDFRIDVDYEAGAAGLIEMYIDGAKVYSRKGGLPIGTNGHLDYGIYLTGFGTMGIGLTTPRTAYFSNLSCGRR
jgi:hypothetical protein